MATIAETNSLFEIDAELDGLLDFLNQIFRGIALEFPDIDGGSPLLENDGYDGSGDFDEKIGAGSGGARNW